MLSLPPESESEEDEVPKKQVPVKVPNPPVTVISQSNTVVPPLPLAPIANNSNTIPDFNPNNCKRTYSVRRYNFVLKRNFTAERLNSIRLDNQRLQEACDRQAKRLKQEEQEYQILDNYFQQWQKQQEHLLQRLQCSLGTS